MARKEKNSLKLVEGGMSEVTIFMLLAVENVVLIHISPVKNVFTGHLFAVKNVEGA